MPKKTKRPPPVETPGELRRRAQRLVGKHDVNLPEVHEEADLKRLLHELEVHQIELEMQNAELRTARDETEAMLEKYSNLYDLAPISYFTLSAEGTIRLANLTGSTLVRVERSKLMDRSFAMLIAPEHRSRFRAFLKQVFAGEIKQADEFILVAGDPLPRVVSIEAKRSPNGLDCNAVVVDVTERTRVEDQLRVSELRYRRLFEAAHDGVLLVDPDTCKITDANPFMTQLIGYPRDHLIGKQLYEIGLHKDNAASKEMFRELKQNHQVRYDDLPLVSQSGRHQEVEVVANLYQEGGRSVIQCNVRDITERKQIEDIMQRKDALISALIEQAPVGVYVVDADFRLQQANPMAMPVFQNIKSLIGRDFSEIMQAIWPRKTADQIIRRFKLTLKTGKPYQTTNFVERRQDIGVQEIYEWQIQRVTLPAGEYGVVCFFNNITERTRAEAAQRRLEVITTSNLKLREEIVTRLAVEKDLISTRLQQSQLLKQSRIQQKQLRGLSHGMLHAQEEERKNISRELHDVIAQTLLGINVHLSALIDGAAADPTSIKQQISRTQVLVESGVDIVHQFARSLRPTMLDDLGLIPSLKTFMQRFSEETSIRVSFSAFAKIEKITDPARTALYRIVQESLTNVARHSNASQSKVSIVSHEGRIIMTIKDNGRGFDVNATTGQIRSTRLGLIGMRERVEMLGGTFLVTSTIGQSTTVSVEIPGAKKTGKRQLHLD